MSMYYATSYTIMSCVPIEIILQYTHTHTCTRTSTHVYACMHAHYARAHNHYTHRPVARIFGGGFFFRENWTFCISEGTTNMACEACWHKHAGF